MQRFNLVDSISRISKYSGVRKEVTMLLNWQKNKCASYGLTFRPTDLIELDYLMLINV